MQSKDIPADTGEKQHIKEQSGYTIVLDNQAWTSPSPICKASDLLKEDSGGYVPAKIQQMIELYEYGDGSFNQKCRNFYRQGMFMKDYEDNAPWYGDINRYFPVYHDLNLKQLRGYFTWRTRIRRGEFTKTCSTFAYIYIYELLNGIGTSSLTETLEKLRQFQAGYIDTGMGSMFMRSDVRKWMFELCVISGLPNEFTRQFADAGIMARDTALSILRNPEKYSLDEVFNSLMRFSGSKIHSSPVISTGGGKEGGGKESGKSDDRGKELFAEIWRRSSAAHIHLPHSDESVLDQSQSITETDSGPKDLFTICFGESRRQPWHPLAKAVYYNQRQTENSDSRGYSETENSDSRGDSEYVFNDCRKYICRDGVWQEERIEGLTADWTAFLSFMHAADLRLRRKLKTGHYLREKKDEAWAYACVDTALEEIRRAEIEASRPKISIDVSGLDKIREDAEITRDSLLTDDEKQDGGEHSFDNDNETVGDADVLDEMQREILSTLLSGGSTSALIRAKHLMASVVADSINEALFDDIGDSVVECDGDELSLVEDYREDIEQLIGGNR